MENVRGSSLGENASFTPETKLFVLARILQKQCKCNCGFVINKAVV